MAIAFAVPAAAQSCVGRGVGGLAGSAVLGEAAFVQLERHDAIELGATYWWNPRGPAAFSATRVRRFADGDDRASWLTSGRLIAQLPRILPLPPGAGICVDLGASLAAGEGDAIHIPIGLSLGFTLPAGPRLRIYPYARPHITFLPDIVEGNSTASGIEAGAGAAYGPLVGGLAITRAFDWPDSVYSNPDLRIALQLGVRF